jgi:hypothetical protein
MKVIPDWDFELYERLLSEEQKYFIRSAYDPEESQNH